MNEPIQRTIEVQCSVEHAFRVFTEKVDLWWPRSHRRDQGSTLHFEPHPGGRFVERTPSGEHVELGRVLLWRPSERLVYNWWPGSHVGPTQVEVVFSPSGEGTRVEVLHREGESGLAEQWTERAQRFARAWAQVLPAFERFCSEPAASSPPDP